MFSSDGHDIALAESFEFASELTTVGVVFVELVEVEPEFWSDLFFYVGL